MKRQMCRGTIGAIACLYALILLAGKGWAQDTWTWQQQCDSNEWRAICSIPDPADCGYDEYDNPIHRYLNNWGHSRCGERPGLPGPGSICIFPMGANARLNGIIDVLNISISNGATFSWQEGLLMLRNPSDNSSGKLTNAGLLLIVRDPSPPTYRYLSGVLVNSGTLVHEAGDTAFYGATLVNSGTLIHEAGSTYFQGATLENRATAEVRAGRWFHSSGTNRVVNTGTLRKVLPAPNNPTSFSITVNTTNSGRIDVQNGTLSFSNLTQTAGETRLHRGATLSVSNPLAMQGGKLTGAGQLSGALNNTAGTIAPGIDDPDQPDLNPLGILTISGNLTLGNDAVFEVELAGTDNSDPANPQYDQLIVGQSGYTRTVQLNGTLRVKARDGYTPAMGDTFDILVRSGSWNRTGEFHTVEVDPDTLPCVAFEVQYLADRVRLIARLTTDPDVNGDGCVDDADLLAVLFAFGQTGSNLAEDINCDEVVDDADLLSVLFAFGSGC